MRKAAPLTSRRPPCLSYRILSGVWQLPRTWGETVDCTSFSSEGELYTLEELLDRAGCVLRKKGLSWFVGGIVPINPQVKAFQHALEFSSVISDSPLLLWLHSAAHHFPHHNPMHLLLGTGYSFRLERSSSKAL